MQPKKRTGTRGTPAHAPPVKGQGPRRPVGVQSLGPVRYEELRRALRQLGAVTVR